MSRLRGSDPVLDDLIQHGHAVTRESYLRSSFGPGEIPYEPLPGELEAGLPPFLQHLRDEQGEIVHDGYKTTLTVHPGGAGTLDHGAGEPMDPTTRATAPQSS